MNILTYFNCPDTRATATYYFNSLNLLEDLKLLTKEPDENSTYDLQLMIEYPGCYEDVHTFLKKRMASKKVFYSIDPYITFDTVKHYYSKYDLDYVFTTQKSYVDKFKEEGIDKVHWLPVAAHQMHMNVNKIRPGVIKPVYDLAFVGTLFNNKQHDDRYNLLMDLYKNFEVNPIHLAIPEENGLVYQTAKIGFNKSVNGDLNMRSFEIMAAGRLLMTDKQDGMEDLSFEDSCINYTNMQDLIEQTRHFLKNDLLREEIAKKGYERVRNNHLYIHRAKELLSVLKF